MSEFVLLRAEEKKLTVGADPPRRAAASVAGMTRRLTTWLRARPLAGDAALAAGAVLVEIVLTLLAPPELRPGSILPAFAWSAVCAAPLALRRVALPVAVGAALATLAVPPALDLAPATQSITFLALTYTVAASRPMHTAAITACVLWLPVAAVNVLTPMPSGPFDITPAYAVLNNTLIALVSFFVGRTVQARRAATEVFRERARIAEDGQRALADQAVADERRRIARELHDMVAHHVSVMGVLATGARRVLHRDPDGADEALGTIEDTSRTTLREMRRLLDVLRTEAEPAAELVPQPDLAGIAALVEQVREAGLPVTLRVEGTPVDLDPGVALTVYRIVQEGLTNALKHAGSATATVRLAVDSAALTVEVADTGRGPQPGVARVGHGLVGMRERVALYGGTLHIGPRPGGGYRVQARMPMDQFDSGNCEGTA
jgi:signal transduction histidine kinase